MQPSIGRIVHYVDDSGEILAAIILKVLDDDKVGLEIFRLGKEAIQWTDVAFDPGQDDDKTYATGNYKPGTWHWPPRV